MEEEKITFASSNSFAPFRLLQDFSTVREQSFRCAILFVSNVICFPVSWQSLCRNDTNMLEFKRLVFRFSIVKKIGI
jgi:hypothetical protein